ncbi:MULTISPECIES: arginase family protein [Cohnella]|jgi:arginase family enzyme|uniref:arginase family protein n=1 Tax=Cohnella TaxID=329857 RepID=UPI00036CDBFF|nr:MULTISPECIES: arginase family protein [Cohnella]REK60761.1 MAG: hypothetical protein C6P35_18200 [Cohnella sp.]
MKGVSVLNFDQSLCPQLSFRKPAYEWIDFTDIRQTNGYCVKDSVRKIDARLRARRNRGVTVIGGGNYHYVSYLLLSEMARPFTLVLFDYHTEMLEPPDESLLSCGSWVLEAIRNNPFLAKVLLLGVGEEGLREIPASVGSKVAAYSVRSIEGLESDVRSIVSQIPTELVYVSIDKDVLNRNEAVTDWDQGNVTLRQLLGILDGIASSRKIAGVDICGEYPYSPVHAYRKEIRRALNINERTNRVLVDRAIRWIERKDAS